MKSKITDKYQITIPREIRDRLKLSIHDVLEWKFSRGLVVVEPVHAPLLKFKGSLKVGKGDIRDDIVKARRIIAREKKYTVLTFDRNFHKQLKKISIPCGQL